MGSSGIGDYWWHAVLSGVATGGSRGSRVPPLTAKNLPKIGKKRGEIGKNREKRGKIGKKKAKIGKVLSLCPS